MTNMTFSVDEDLYRRMKKHPEIKWTEILRQSLIKFLNTLESLDQETVEEFRAKLKPEVLKKIDSINTENEDLIQQQIYQSKKRRLQHLHNLEQGLEE